MARELYIVFSSTNCMIGRIIRFFAENKYNHVSFSVDPASGKLFSFARFHRNAPFYSGFVEESVHRYFVKMPAEIKVFRISLSEKQWSSFDSALNAVRENADQYLYNTFSALAYPFHRRLYIENAFTCLEFLVYILRKAGIAPLRENTFYSLQEIEVLFAPYVVFEGPCDGFFSFHPYGADRFPEKLSLPAAFSHSLVRHLRLFKRMLF